MLTLDFSHGKYSVAPLNVDGGLGSNTASSLTGTAYWTTTDQYLVFLNV